MDATDGATTPALNRISASIREYSLFQGVRQVLQRLRDASPQASEDALYERLEFQANPSLGFPGSDIDAVRFFEERGELRAQLRINLVSLFGAGSPLPAFYSEQALSDGTPGATTRDFLDLFNDRLQRLLFPIWQKYRYHARFAHGASDPLSEQLFALIGIAGKPLRTSQDLDWKRLLPYLGLLSRRVHGAALIEAVLRYYFKHAALHIEQCVERRVAIDAQQHCRLGQDNSRLADDLVLGTRVRDRSGKFRLHIRQLDWPLFHQFLPIGGDHKPLSALLRFVLRDPLEHDIRLQLQQAEIRPLHIGQQNPCLLGWTTWLGHERADGLVTLAPHRAQTHADQ